MKLRLPRWLGGVAPADAPPSGPEAGFPVIPARIPEGQRVYAVGDIHGRADLLEAMLGLIRADAAGFKGPVTLVLLGDLINRGPDSRQVVETLLAFRAALPEGWGLVALQGNHEYALQLFLADPETRPEWISWGGDATLASYGIRLWAPDGRRRGPTALAAEFALTLEETGHRSFYDSLPLTWSCGGYLFVHAGVRAGVPLERQDPADLLFIRRGFLDRPHGLPFKVVFGHTIFPEPLVAGDRIGLDTGAFQSGRLSCAVLEGESLRLLRT